MPIKDVNNSIPPKKVISSTDKDIPKPTFPDTPKQVPKKVISSTDKDIPKSTLQNTPKQISQKVNYKYIGKESLGQAINKAIPRQFIATKRMASIFGGIFIIVLIIAAFQFPYSKLMSGNTDITIKIGYPMTFLELELVQTDNRAIKIGGLILDIILYLILAYGIDISINLILDNPLLQSEEKIKQKPVTFKNRESSLAERAAEKFVGKPTEKK